LKSNFQSARRIEYEAEAFMNPLYAPVVLVVDDDPNVLVRLRRGFLEDTTMGVLTAGDLTSAASFLADRSLKIDALVTDLGSSFQSGPDSDLRDGLDLVDYAARIRPEIPIWILSAVADDGAYQDRARTRLLPIQAWFAKFGGLQVPWKAIEPKCWFRALMGNLMGGEGEASILDLAMTAGIDLRSVEADAALVKQIRKTLHPIRRTYLTNLPEPFSAIKPIVALVREEEEGVHLASAPDLGFIAHAQGADAEEAMETLSCLIVAETEFLLKQARPVSGYAAYVREKLAAAVTWRSAA
jgi:CheY-like chemotaxis protein